MDTRQNQAAGVFANAFAESLARSLTQTLAATWQLKVLDAPEIDTPTSQPVHFRLTLSGAIGGDCFVEFYEPYVTELASNIAGKQSSSPGEEPTLALEKVISSAMPAVISSLSTTYGAFACKVNYVEGLALGGMLAVPLAVSEGEQSGMPVSLYFDAPLLTALSSTKSAEAPREAENRTIDPLNLRLVMDVELNVSLRFGQRKLPLREVLELASGSVVELDRQVDDPVELLLDGKVIARGEAVIVDGNYGLRVTEIPQPIASHFTR